MPFVASLLRPRLSASPIRGQIVEFDAVGAKGIRHVVCHHCQLGQQSGFLDVNQFLQDTKRGRRRAISHCVTNRIPPAVKKQAIATIEHFRMLPA